MQTVQLGDLISAQMDALGKSGERFESQVRAVQKTGKDQPDAIKHAAQEFESLFISYLLKVMRETIEESGLTEGGFGKGIYTDLFDQELSRSVARAGGLGISDMIFRKLAPEAMSQGGTIPSTGDVKTESSNRSRRPGNEIPDHFLPVSAPISSTYGLRRDPIDGQVRFHRGLDLAAPAGTAVLAPWEGKVVSTGFDSGYGNYVVVEHPEGFRTRYAHLETATVRKGDAVSAGEELGTVGSSGRSTGAHLHFEVIRNGEQVDPRMALTD